MKACLTRVPDRRILAAVLLAAALLLLPAATASADGPWYVDAGLGDDSRSCLAPGLQACRTIGAAIGRAAEGDSILIAAGAYTETLAINRSLSLAGHSTENTLIDGGGSGPVVRILAEGVRLTRLTVRNGAAAGEGGALYLAGSVTLSAVDIVDSRAYQGGGVYVRRGQLTVLGGRIAGNTALDAGGGVYVAEPGASVTLEGSEVIGNHAVRVGGGLLLDRGAAILTNARMLTNTASAGAGIVISDFTASLAVSGGAIAANTAESSGGGLFVVRGLANLFGVRIEGNAAANGGGLLVSNGTVNVMAGRILSNTAGGAGGGALLVPDTVSGTLSIQAACIAYNSDDSLARDSQQGLAAQGNWWGAATGPSGHGPGGGDSVGPGVDYGGWLTAPPDGCPTLSADLAVSALASPSVVLPGQPVTLSVGFSNDGPAAARRLFISATLPASMTTVAGEAWSEAGSVDSSGSWGAWAVDRLPPGARGVVTLTTVISPSLAAAEVLASSTAIEGLTPDPEPSNNAGEATVLVVLPRVSFASESYEAREGDGWAAIAVTVTPALYSSAAVDVVAAWLPVEGQEEALPIDEPTATLTFEPGQTSADLVLPVPDDEQPAGDRIMVLWLRSPVGLSLGPVRTATLTVRDDERRTYLPLVSSGSAQAAD